MFNYLEVEVPESFAFVFTAEDDGLVYQAVVDDYGKVVVSWEDEECTYEYEEAQYYISLGLWEIEEPSDEG
jgi:hypothetical protein